MPRTIVEPFRIKSVEPISWTTRPRRRARNESNCWGLRFTTCFFFLPTTF